MKITKYIVISRSRLATACTQEPRRQVPITGYKNSQSVKFVVVPRRRETGHCAPLRFLRSVSNQTKLLSGVARNTQHATRKPKRGEAVPHSSISNTKSQAEQTLNPTNE